MATNILAWKIVVTQKIRLLCMRCEKAKGLARITASVNTIVNTTPENNPFSTTEIQIEAKGIARVKKRQKNRALEYGPCDPALVKQCCLIIS